MIGFGLLLCSSGGFGPGFWLFSPSPPPPTPQTDSNSGTAILLRILPSVSRSQAILELVPAVLRIRDCVPFWPLYAGSSMNNAEDNLMSLKGIFWFVCGIRDGDSSDPVTVMVESRIRDKHLPDPPHWVPVNTCSGFKQILPLCFRYRIHQPSKSGTKAWYRCTSYSSNKCRATAVLRKSTNTLIKVTRPHNHSPGFLPDFAR